MVRHDIIPSYVVKWIVTATARDRTVGRVAALPHFLMGEQMDAVFKVTAFCHNEKGHHWQNVFHYSVTGSPSDDTKFATALALADAWEAKMKVAYLQCMGADTTLDVVAAVAIDPPPGTTATSIVNEISGAAVEGVSSGIAGDLLWVDGGDTGRFTRTFLANPPKDSLVGDSFTPAYVAKVDAFADLMIAELALGPGKGDATFVHWVPKTKERFAIVVANLQDKATMLNKRTVPNL